MLQQKIHSRLGGSLPSESGSRVGGNSFFYFHTEIQEPEEGSAGSNSQFDEARQRASNQSAPSISRFLPKSG
jgi:hypothetical protein